MLKKNFPKTKIIESKENEGYAKASNKGIKIAKGKYICLFNSDAYLTDDSFKNLLKRAEEIENLGAIAPQILNEDKTIQQSVGFLPNLMQVFWWMSFVDDLPFGDLLKPYHIDHDRFYKKERQAGWLTGAAFLIPKKVIKKAGPLDGKIFMYGEDFEWCYRIQKAGFKIYFSPTAKVVHIGQGSSQRISKNAIVGEYKGIVYFYKKHKSNLSLQIARFLLKIGALVRIIIFGSLGIIRQNAKKKELAKFYVEALKVA